MAKARQRCEDARRLIAENADPGLAKQTEKTAGGLTLLASLLLSGSPKQNPARARSDKATWIFEQLLFPELGDRPVRVFTAPDLLAVLRKIEERGAVETAHRAKQRASQVFRYAIATGRAAHDPAGGLRWALTPKDVEHRAAIAEPKRVGELLRAIDGYVEMGEIHIVPLAAQAVDMLRAIQPLTGAGRFVFPSLRTVTRPISEGTVNAALRRLGFSKEDMTGHGLRTMASTLLNEQGWHPTSSSCSWRTRKGTRCALRITARSGLIATEDDEGVGRLHRSSKGGRGRRAASSIKQCGVTACLG